MCQTVHSDQSIAIHELSFDRPLSQREVSILFGVRQRRIQQIEKRALAKVRAEIERNFPQTAADREWADRRWAERMVS